MKTLRIFFTSMDVEGLEVELSVPAKWEICRTCEGHGASSAYLGAFTRDDFDDEGPEFVEDYIAGNYDRACDECHGSGKVIVADEAACQHNDEDKRALGVLHSRWEEEAEYRAIVDAERRAGA